MLVSGREEISEGEEGQLRTRGKKGRKEMADQKVRGKRERKWEIEHGRERKRKKRRERGKRR